MSKESSMGWTARRVCLTAGMCAVMLWPGAAFAASTITGTVTFDVADFTLAGPNRIVLDLTGAALRMPPRYYDKVVRGGITNVRYAQYKPDVVRIVLDLDAAKAYKVERKGDEIRVSFAATQSAFKEWNAGGSAVPAQRVVRAEEPVAEEPSDEEVEAARTAGPEVAVPLVQTAAWRSRQEPRITVTWDRASIADVVAGFAAFSGRTIILGKDIAAGPLPVLGNLILHLVYGAVLGSIYAIDLEAWLDGSEADRAHAEAQQRGAAFGTVVGMVVGLAVGWLIGPSLDDIGSRGLIVLIGALTGGALGLAAGSLGGAEWADHQRERHAPAR